MYMYIYNITIYSNIYIIYIYIYTDTGAARGGAEKCGRDCKRRLILPLALPWGH